MNARRSTTQDEPTGPTLQEIIYQAKGEGTWEDLSDRTAETPGGPPRIAVKWLQDIAYSGAKTIDPKKVRALADASGLSHVQILDAWGRSHGLVVDRETRSRLEIRLPVGHEDLDEDQLDATLALLNSQIAANRRRKPPGRRSSSPGTKG